MTSKILSVLLSPNGDPGFIHKMKKVIKETIAEVLQVEEISHIKNIEYIIEYISSAQIGLISFWLSNNMAISIIELSKLIRQITLLGPIEFLKIQAEANDNSNTK